jgi:rhodanese-related sulfurtransferase
MISRNVLEWRLDPASEYHDSRAPSLDDVAIVVCNEGYQSSLVAATLLDAGNIWLGLIDVLTARCRAPPGLLRHHRRRRLGS